jgi:hypothetical protein
MPLKIPPPYVSFLPKILAGETVAVVLLVVTTSKKKRGKN